jgi:hypothetical protein
MYRVILRQQQIMLLKSHRIMQHKIMARVHKDLVSVMMKRLIDTIFILGE